MGLIYNIKLENNNCRYIGQTIKSLKRRMYEHKHSSKTDSKQPVHCWIRKHGFENVVIEVLCNVENKSLDAYEKFFIVSGNYFEFDLLNVKQGGNEGKFMKPINKKIRKTKFKIPKVAKENSTYRNHVCGELVGNAKLNKESVSLIKQLLRDGSVKQKEIASQFKVAPCTINEIASGKTWKHVA
jgi:group I intron endonuclease